MRDREPERPVVNVVGERVALGPLQRDLLPAYQRWSNDLAAADRLGSLPRPVTLEGQTAWYDHEVAQITFTIYERATWRAIGGCSLIEVDHRSGTARLVILIGEADARGQGYGTEAVRLLLDIAFTALGLHSVMLGVDEFNRVGRRAYEKYEKAGFRECGRRRQARVMGGRRWDEIFMDCLATEFTSPVLGRVFVADEPRS